MAGKSTFKPTVGHHATRHKHGQFKFVFAELDRTMPIDHEHFKKLVEEKLAIPVKNHAFLRRRFEQAGYRGEALGDLYAVLTRRPLKKGWKTLHGRSLSSVGLRGRQFVLKGIGTALPSSASFKLNRETDIPEVQFSGAARASTIKRAIEILAKLEETYKKARERKDPVVQWAEEHWGIRELPVIKHVAVLRPLQFLSLDEGKVKRVRLTRRELEKLGLEQFHGEERIHVYTARQPLRIDEGASVYDQPVYQDHNQAPKTNMFIANAISARTVARGLLLLHIAHQNNIVLSSQYGSPLLPFNASPLEFFDFDTAEELPNLPFLVKAMDFDKLAKTFRIHHLRQMGAYSGADDDPQKVLLVEAAVSRRIAEAMDIAKARFMRGKTKKEKLSEKVKEIEKLAGNNTSKHIKWTEEDYFQLGI